MADDTPVSTEVPKKPEPLPGKQVKFEKKEDLSRSDMLAQAENQAKEEGYNSVSLVAEEEKYWVVLFY